MIRPIQTLVWLLVAALGLAAVSAQADVFDQPGIIRPTEFDDPALEERYRELGQELRCPKCQNQSVGDSDSPIALDLRREIRVMLEDGMSNQEIKDFLQQRYGDYILYQPRLQRSTILLWVLPVTILLLGLLVVGLIARRQRKQSAVSAAPAPDETALEALLQRPHSKDGSGADDSTSPRSDSAFPRSKDTL